MTIYDLQDSLLEGERLKKLEPTAADDSICDDIDQVIERRQMARLREVILHVIDTGDPLTRKAGEIHGLPWALDHPFEDCSNDARLRFCDAVIANLK